MGCSQMLFEGGEYRGVGLGVGGRQSPIAVVRQITEDKLINSSIYPFFLRLKHIVNRVLY